MELIVNCVVQSELIAMNLLIYSGISGADPTGDDELCRTSDIENRTKISVANIAVRYLLCRRHYAWHPFRYIQ